jgi:hypothetical protein
MFPPLLMISDSQAEGILCVEKIAGHDLTIDLLKNRIIESRLVSLSVILSSSMIFFYNWIFQEIRKSKLKRFSFDQLYGK